MAARPAPPARIRSTSVPCGTISSVISPAMICFSASETTPGRAEKQVTRCAIWWLSASNCPVGNPGWPRPLQYTVSPREPFAPSSEMSVDGYRCDRPNPATPMLAPSPISTTASAAVITFPLAGAFITTEFPSCLRADLPWLARGDLGVLDDPVGDDSGDFRVVLLQHHRVAVAVNAQVAEPDLVDRGSAGPQVLRGRAAGGLE